MLEGCLCIILVLVLRALAPRSFSLLIRPLPLLLFICSPSPFPSCFFGFDLSCFFQSFHFLFHPSFSPPPSLSHSLSSSLSSPVFLFSPSLLSFPLLPSISIGAGTVVEYCTLEEEIKVGRNCIISNLHVPVSLIDDVMHASCNNLGGNSVHITMGASWRLQL